MHVYAHVVSMHVCIEAKVNFVCLHLLLLTLF